MHKEDGWVERCGAARGEVGEVKVGVARSGAGQNTGNGCKMGRGGADGVGGDAGEGQLLSKI